jgi:glycosyltransferase 2 family protein
VAEKNGRRKGWMALPTLAGLLIGGTCAFFVGRALVDQWSDVRADIASASPGWLVAAFVLAVAAMLWVAGAWADVLRALGYAADRRRTVAWFFVGEIGKYVPGGVWSVLGRGEIARRSGVPAAKAYPSVALSLASHYLAALALCTVLVPLDIANQADDPAALAFLLLLPVGLIMLHPRVLGPLKDLAGRYVKKARDVTVPPWPVTIGLVVRYVPAWMLATGATWCVARALMPDPSLLRIGIATTLAWTAGLLAIPVPAGGGVREAVFMAASGMAAGPAAAVAVGSRLIFTVVDVGGAAATAPWHRRTSSRPAAEAGSG